MIDGLVGGVQDWWSRFNVSSGFGVAKRLTFYRSLGMLLRNRTKLEDALWRMYEIASERGSKTSRPMAIILAECHSAVSRGRTLSSVLARYAPMQEVSLIEAGERAGTLFVGDEARREGRKGAFEFATEVALANKQIKSALQKAFAYPIVLTLMASVVLRIVSTRLVPSMAKASNPDTWTGAGLGLKMLADVTTDYGLYILGAVVALVVLVIWSFPRWRGNARVIADRFWPYSMYRMIHGSTFLLNVAVLLRSGVMLNEALIMLANRANPWLRERIEAAAIGTASGSDLGDSLARAEFDFPAKEAVQYLQILGSNKGADEAIEDYAREWQKDSIASLEKTSGTILIAGIMLIGALMALIIVGSAEITDAVQARVNGR